MPNYQILNQIIVSGKPASPPRQITGGRKAGKYLLVLAVQTPDTPKGVLSFPIVVADELPECVLSCDYRGSLQDRPTITVIGHLRTDNITLDLREEVLRLARKASAPGRLLQRLDALLSKAAERSGNLRTRRVGTEIRAEQILQGGLW